MQENLIDPPSVSQAFTNEAPSGGNKTALFNSLSGGAKAFIREFIPDDDNKDCIVSFEVVKDLQTFKTELKRQESISKGIEPGPECEVYDDVVYIRKTVRGNDTLEVHRPKWIQDEREFPYAWQEFKRGLQGVSRGTPLTKLGLDISLIRRLSSKNVECIEDLALVTDTWLQNLGPGARDHRRKAVEYLETHKIVTAANASPEIQQMKTTLDEQKKMLDQAMELIKKQSEENAALAARLTEKRGPGRPPKEVE